MIRITTTTTPGERVLVTVGGTLTARWAALLETELSERLDAPELVDLDLSGLTDVDARGVETLRRLVAMGVRLVQCPPLIAELLDAGPA